MSVLLATHPIPTEVLHAIAFHLVALTPLGPPAALLPLLRVSKALHHALSFQHNPSLYAQICRLKFDTLPIARRAFTPSALDLAEQLQLNCQLLHLLKNGPSPALDTVDGDGEDEEIVERVLFGSLVLLQENDGKNMAQLVHAGLEAYVDLYIRKSLYRTRENFDGWPDDGLANSCALWLKWMLTTTEKLLAETQEQREELIATVLPFVLLPFRYPAGEAPPIHYTLPLPSSSSPNHPTPILAFSIPTPHGPYPIYPPPSRQLRHPYMGAYIPLSCPPITSAAKLIYFSRREVIPFGIPPHLARTRAELIARRQAAIARGEQVNTDPTPTQEDMIEVNSHKGARVLGRVVWDWELGRPVRMGLDKEGRREVCKDGEEAGSVRWDRDWARERMCADLWKKLPKHLPYRMFEPGCLTGLWQGRLLIPSENEFNRLIRTPQYPAGPQGFRETSVFLTTQPLFMRLQEHHCIHPNTPVPAPDEKRTTTTTMVNPVQMDVEGEQVEVNLGMRNAWFPGRPGGVHVARDYTSSSTEREKVRVFTDYDYDSPHHRLNAPAYVYETYDPAKRSEHKGLEGDCELCLEQERVKERVRREEEVERERLLVENVFGSVGLGRSRSRSGSPSSSSSGSSTPGEEEEDERETDVEMEDVADFEVEMEGDDYPFGEPEFVNEQGVKVRATRRIHEKGKFVPCDGVKDVIITGSTDDRHALAWNNYTFYGRVRPWDGMIGIMRMMRYPAINHVFFYGYVVGGTNFIGNWRVAVADPLMPAWESAFVMSRREDA